MEEGIRLHISQDRVLVMLSSYNGEKHIREQIESIFCQDGDFDVTLQIRDDGSSDATTSIVEALQEEYPGRIQLNKGSHVGVNESFFELLEQAGEYDFYAISDQDDIWLPHKLSTAVQCIRDVEDSDTVPVLFSSVSLLIRDDRVPFGQTRELRRPITMRNAVLQNMCSGHKQVFNRPLLELIRMRDDTGWSDLYAYDLWIENVAALYGQIRFVNQPCVLYRQHAGNVFGTRKSRAGRLFLEMKRTLRGAGKKNIRQLKKFLLIHGEELKTQGLYDSLKDFTEATGFFARLRALREGAYYRQDRAETVMIYLLYLLGLY